MVRLVTRYDLHANMVAPWKAKSHENEVRELHAIIGSYGGVYLLPS
jgi:hypothetical protein